MNTSALPIAAMLLTVCMASQSSRAASDGMASPLLQSASPDIVEVRSGQTLSGIFAARRLGASVLVRLLRAGEHGKRLQRLRVGDRIEFVRDADGALAELILRPDAEHIYRFVPAGSGFTSSLETIPLKANIVVAHGIISGNLYDVARTQGLSNALIVALAAVFEWDLDLSRDLRRGDRFSVVYEELYLHGRKVRDGQVLAAELVTRRKTYRSVRYEDPNGRSGNFTPDGRSVQKAFLRSPVEFSRVSSGFSAARRHPVLHKVRAHRGVDYAAAHGTPIRATGDGKVRFAGTKGGFGRTVVLAHGGQYTTLYAHLSGFAPSVRPGAHVQQGQVIGYVGSSGLATGPHLHYEFQVNGKHRNPLTVALPEGRPVPAQLREHFKTHTASLVARLDSAGIVQLAQVN